MIRGNDVVRETILLQAKNTSLSVLVYPGTQGNVLNNVYVITLPEGQTIMHTGDQDFIEDLAAKMGAGQVDILFVQCWMLPMDQFVAGVKPALVITGHENEMLHTIDHRESYWLTFRRISEAKALFVIMAWGESYTIP
jgi:L-ascorbate metabolism protein UlaG (beta-lactamase superfamily)